MSGFKKHIDQTRALATADVPDYIDTFYIILFVATVTSVESALSNLKRFING